MKCLLKIAAKIIGVLLLLPITYLLSALALTCIPINTPTANQETKHAIWLTTNGVHLDFVLPIEDVSPELLQGLRLPVGSRYVAFGWGDANFYLNTPTWGDLTFANAVNALFLESPTLMHVTGYRNQIKSWVKVSLSAKQLSEINSYLLQGFKLNESSYKVWVANQAYSKADSFYEANGNYTALNTCNSWVNKGLKKANLPACLWTPFDFGILSRYTSK